MKSWFHGDNNFFFLAAELNVGFNPNSYVVREGEMAMLTIVLNRAFDMTITVDLVTNPGSATGIMSLHYIRTSISRCGARWYLLSACADSNLLFFCHL